MRISYHQLKVREEDIQKTSFRMRYGHYEFLVIPFRVINVRETFMDLMNRILKEYLDQFIFLFIDHIMIYSKSPEEHTINLRIVLRILHDKKLFAMFSKCEFWLGKVLRPYAI